MTKEARNYEILFANYVSANPTILFWFSVNQTFRCLSSRDQLVLHRM